MLGDNQDRHLSAQEILDLTRARQSDVSLATVYRTLDLLRSLGMVSATDFGDGRQRYELIDPGPGHQHHHLVCVRCGTISEVRADLLHRLEEMVLSEYGFVVSDHNLHFLGLCRACVADERGSRP